VTKRRPRRDVFGYTAFFRGFLLISAAICVTGFVSEYRKPPVSRSAFRFYGFLGLALFSVVAVAESWRARIELRDDEIRVVALLGHRSYPRSQVSSATWARGCPVSLGLRDGTWAHLPDTGHANTKLAGAIRAWLNESSALSPDRPTST
jgi:hypothetical protein